MPYEFNKFVFENKISLKSDRAQRPKIGVQTQIKLGEFQKASPSAAQMGQSISSLVIRAPDMIDWPTNMVAIYGYNLSDNVLEAPRRLGWLWEPKSGIGRVRLKNETGGLSPMRRCRNEEAFFDGENLCMDGEVNNNMFFKMQEWIPLVIAKDAAMPPWQFEAVKESSVLTLIVWTWGGSRKYDE